MHNVTTFSFQEPMLRLQGSIFGTDGVQSGPAFYFSTDEDEFESH